jgi:DNA mismatch repair protein MutS
VARLAGLPPEVIIRAEAVLAELEEAAAGERGRQLSLLPRLEEATPAQIEATAVVEEIKALDFNRMTPLEALQLLARLQERLYGN